MIQLVINIGSWLAKRILGIAVMYGLLALGIYFFQTCNTAP